MEEATADLALSLRGRLNGRQTPQKPSAPEGRDRRWNSLQDLLAGIAGPGGYGTEQTLSMPYTLAMSSAYTPFTLNRVTLSYAFMTFGVIQRLINRPVKDSFKDGFTIKTDELDKNDLNRLMSELKRNRKRDRNKKLARNTQGMAWQSANDFGNSDLGAVQKTSAWGRLYGGAGLVINTAQDFRTPLILESISKDSALEFIDADRWELIMANTNVWDERNPTPFTYYGLPLHRSRVIKVIGVEAPSFIRLRLQGWGMSTLECCVRSLQELIKFDNLVFELLDESKIDVYKIVGFNTSLLSGDGIERAKQRILEGNRMKNFQNAVVMDKEDDYDQKQLGTIFSGLASLWQELRLNFCADTGIPMNVLFGTQSTGFSGGADAIQNYNRLIETTREESEPLLGEVVDLRSQQLFGFVPEYQIEWPALAEMPETEEQQVKSAKQTRVLERFDRGLQTGQESLEELDKEGVMDQETEVGRGERDVDPMAKQQLDADAERDSQASANRPKSRDSD